MSFLGKSILEYISFSSLGIFVSLYWTVTISFCYSAGMGALEAPGLVLVQVSVLGSIAIWYNWELLGKEDSALVFAVLQ